MVQKGHNCIHAHNLWELNEIMISFPGRIMSRAINWSELLLSYGLGELQHGEQEES